MSAVRCTTCGAEVEDGVFYWAWVDNSTQWARAAPVAEVVRAVIINCRLCWEGCGTDEGVRVLRVISRVAVPSVVTG